MRWVSCYEKVKLWRSGGVVGGVEVEECSGEIYDSFWLRVMLGEFGAFQA